MELVVEGVDLSDLLEVPYVGRRHPGNVALQDFLENPKTGANCQLFALGVLDIAGFLLDPGMRSSELWLDCDFTERIQADCLELMAHSHLEAFDIVFFMPKDADPNDFKKLHVGLYLGNPSCGFYKSVLHNARPGPSCIWPYERFAQSDRQYTLLGAKRPMRYKV